MLLRILNLVHSSIREALILSIDSIALVCCASSSLLKVDFTEHAVNLGIFLVFSSLFLWFLLIVNFAFKSLIFPSSYDLLISLKSLGAD